MCCFSRSVESVSDTNIFARLSNEPGREFLVYSMSIKAGEDLAMILPIPTPKGSAEDAVNFINLERYANFFDDMRKGFPLPRHKKEPAGSLSAFEDKLKVVEVGSFEASFVPAVSDFNRLDKRFRLPDGTWNKLPQYKEYGFAVFKLKKGANTIHPMAFDFPTSLTRQLFFPTVHIHDGEVHDTASFDHTLYGQLEGVDSRLAVDWLESPQPAGMFMNKELAGKVIDPDSHVYQRSLRGKLKNQDVIV